MFGEFSNGGRAGFGNIQLKTGHHSDYYKSNLVVFHRSATALLRITMSLLMVKIVFLY